MWTSFWPSGRGSDAGRSGKPLIPLHRSGSRDGAVSGRRRAAALPPCPCQDALKMFLGVAAEVSAWNADGTACSLLLKENPIASPSRAGSAPCSPRPTTPSRSVRGAALHLRGSAVFWHPVRCHPRRPGNGAPSTATRARRASHLCRQVRFKVTCYFVRDALKGDDVNEIKCVPRPSGPCRHAVADSGLTWLPQGGTGGTLGRDCWR